MTDPTVPDPIARLEAAVAADPGDPGFAALAEAHRRAGRLGDAEGLARRGLERAPGSLEGGLVLCLALLDQNRVVEAREQLEKLAAERIAARGFAAPAEPGGELSDAELESAFAGARTDPDEVIDADRIAQEAMREADRALAEEIAARPGATFATHTLANLLERQGDPGAASQVRAAIGGRPDAERERVVATLETWLANLRSAAR